MESWGLTKMGNRRLISFGRSGRDGVVSLFGKGSQERNVFGLTNCPESIGKYRPHKVRSIRTERGSLWLACRFLLHIVCML